VRNPGWHLGFDMMWLSTEVKIDGVLGSARRQDAAVIANRRGVESRNSGARLLNVYL
jgi:hypothetical protein